MGPIVVCNVCTSVFSPVQAILSAFWTNCCRLGREASQQTTALHSTSPLNFCCQFTTLYFLATAPVLSNQTSPMLVVQFTFFRNAPTLKGKRNQAFISDQCQEFIQLALLLLCYLPGLYCLVLLTTLFFCASQQAVLRICHSRTCPVDIFCITQF